MEKLHYDIMVKGRVQGVWFRKYTKMEADRLNIEGFVKNLPNGDVYVEAEGDKDQLDTLVKWLHKGSPLSWVYVVESKENEFQNHKYFEISR